MKEGRIREGEDEDGLCVGATQSHNNEDANGEFPARRASDHHQR